ncbi:hypothetical protein DENIS_1369 [Desulfonema ishimotonii]|uniref:Chemotaxis protein n=1 Tax=Desulfonema ishimotonii TaxID=45657 RepID=A0A401FTV6_9BACT|nr:hypothetical protein [Desulfonema ishimotonii]GBC60417.1 hypothetical protein DENIS_1369 [Desulfonema ishimotonii]
MTTLRSSISDTVNDINKLLIRTRDPEHEKRLRRLRRIYFALWEEVIRQEIASNTHEFKEAIEALEEADAAVEAAKQDMENIVKAINKSVSAAKAVDKVVKLGIDLIA